MSQSRKRKVTNRIMQAKSAIAIGDYDECFLESRASNAAMAMKQYTSRLSRFIVEGDANEGLPVITFRAPPPPAPVSTSPQTPPPETEVIMAESAQWEPISNTDPLGVSGMPAMMSSGSVSTFEAKKTRRSKKNVHEDVDKVTSWAEQALRNIYTTASPEEFMDSAPALVFFDPLHLPRTAIMAGILGERGKFVCFLCLFYLLLFLYFSYIF